MGKEIYTPIPEANTERIRASLVLPFRLEEQVGLNTRKIELLSQIGGISHVKIQNDEQSGTTQTIPQVVGIDGQGTAISGATKVSKVPSFRSSHESDTSRYKTSRWAELTIRINSEEIKNRLLKTDQIVNMPDPWAKEINSAIKKSILNSGVKHLMSLERYEKFLAVFLYSLDVLLSTSLVVRAGTPEQFLPEIINQAILTGIFWNIFKPILGDGLEGKGRGSRLSISMGPEIDRAAVLYLASLGKPIAKKLEKSRG